MAVPSGSYWVTSNSQCLVRLGACRSYCGGLEVPFWFGKKKVHIKEEHSDIGQASRFDEVRQRSAARIAAFNRIAEVVGDAIYMWVGLDT